MQPVNGLVASLNGHFRWNKSRLVCFSHLLLGLIRVRTVNLREIALAISGPAQLSSRYRRLQRFFALFDMDLTDIARWIFQLFLSEKDKVYLIIDRTNWYWGKQKINAFMLSIAYEGLALPLFWHLLDTGGCSNQQEQKALLHRYVDLFGTQTIAGLLADREFANGKLLDWLIKKNIPFYIRIKEDSVVCIKKKKLCKAKQLFRNVRPKTTMAFGVSVHVFGIKIFISGACSRRGELMIVLTNPFPKQAIEIYLRRWEIENLFQSLKSKRFRFEEIRLIELERIEKMMALLTIGVAWAHKVGE